MLGLICSHVLGRAPKATIDRGSSLQHIACSSMAATAGLLWRQFNRQEQDSLQGIEAEHIRLPQNV